MDNFLFIRILDNPMFGDMRYHSVILALFNTVYKDFFVFDVYEIHEKEVVVIVVVL